MNVNAKDLNSHELVAHISKGVTVDGQAATLEQVAIRANGSRTAWCKYADNSVSCHAELEGMALVDPLRGELKTK